MEKIKLSDILDTIQGTQFPVEEQEIECKEGYKQFLRISDYTKNDEIPRFVKYSGKEYVCDNDSVVVVRYGNIGFIGYGKEGILANNLFALKVKDGVQVKNKYLYYFLNSNTINQSLITKANTSTMPALTHKMIKDLEIKLHSIEEQNNIINTLDKLNNLIEIRQKQLQSLNELIKSQFVEMFENGNFEKKSLDEISVIRGEYGSNVSAIDYEETLPRYVRITDITSDGKLDKNSLASPKNEENIDRYLLKCGDIIFARTGATVGKTYKYNDEDGVCIYAGYCIRFRLNTEIVDPEYIFRFTQTDRYLKWVETAQRGGAQPNINSKQYGSLLIPIPPFEEQNKFSDIVQQIDKQKFVG